MEQILGFHGLNAHTHFWPCSICTSTLKISSFHLLTLEKQSILESRDPTSHPFLTMPTQKYFILIIYVNLYQHVKNQAISLVKKIYNLIGWEYFGRYIRSRYFPFWSIFPILRAKIIFPKNLTLACTMLKFSSTMPKNNKKKKKNNIKKMPGQKNGRTDETYFTGPFGLPLEAKKKQKKNKTKNQ